MKLLRRKIRWEDDRQDFHLVKNTEWKSEGGYGHKMLNFTISTFCGGERVIEKGDSYVTFDKEIHKKKICNECYKVFKLWRK